MKMTAIDGRVFCGAPAGVARYCRDMILEAAKANPNREYVIFAPSLLAYDDWPENIRTQIIGHSVGRFVKPIVWLKLMGARIAKEKPDRFFACSVYIPFGLSPKTSVVSIVHDFNHRLVPGTMARGNRWAAMMFFDRDLRKASSIIANSRGTADKLLKFNGLHANAIINPTVPKGLIGSSTPNVLKRDKLHAPYLLAVSTIEPRKNIPALIAAFVSSTRMQSLGFKLILVGKNGWGPNTNIPLDNPNVVFTGYIDDQRLSALYSGATAYYMPSLYEGFGMPAREAIAHGCPVVCSDIPELRESSLGKGVYIPPTIEAIRQSMDNEIWLTFPVPQFDFYSFREHEAKFLKERV